MLVYTIASIIVAIMAWIIGFANWAFVLGLLVLTIGVIYSNIHKITPFRIIITIVIIVLFTILEYVFWSIFSVTNIILIINALLLLSLLIFAWNEKYKEVVMIFIILIIMSLLAPILNAWTPIIGDKTQNVNAQLGMGEKTAPAFKAISDGLETIWMMLTDPTGYAENKNNKKGKQEGGDVALEITSVKAMPTTVMPKDEYSMVFELKNLGKNDATNVRVGARVDARAFKHGSYIDDVKYNGNDIKPSWYFMDVDTIHPHEQRYENFNIISPGCSGTFTSRAYVEYTYNAVATTNLEVIKRTYYDELLQHDKLIFKDQLSEASAGPFKLTIRTQYPQPIPVTKSDGKNNTFKIYFTAINEREGQAYINDIAFRVPEELNDTGVCDMIYDESDEKYHLNMVDEDVAKKNRCIEPNDMTSYSCEFYYDFKNYNFERIKTLSLFSEINYTFTYSKSTTTTVKNNVAGYKTCSELDNNRDVVYSDGALTDEQIAIGQSDFEETKKTLISDYCNVSSKITPGMILSNKAHCIVDTKAVAVTAVTKFATACYETWYGAKNEDGIDCGSIIIELKACDTSDFNIETEVKGIGAETTWKNPIIKSVKAYKFDFKYVQSSCTLSGLEIDVNSKKRTIECETDLIEEPPTS